MKQILLIILCLFGNYQSNGSITDSLILADYYSELSINNDLNLISYEIAHPVYLFNQGQPWLIVHPNPNHEIKELSYNPNRTVIFSNYQPIVSKNRDKWEIRFKTIKQVK